MTSTETTTTTPVAGFRLDVFPSGSKSFTFSLFRTATGEMSEHMSKFRSFDAATKAGEKRATTWSNNLKARGVDPESEDL